MVIQTYVFFCDQTNGRTNKLPIRKIIFIVAVTATIEYSCPSVCLSVCLSVCVSVCLCTGYN